MPIYEYQCKSCGQISELLIRTLKEPQEPHCEHCDSLDLTRLISRPALIRRHSQAAEPGTLRAVDPRRAVENMSRMYDQSSLDPGQGFSEVAKRAAAGDSPETLKEVIKEARQKESTTTQSSPSKGASQ